jgi:hypothetical protein
LDSHCLQSNLIQATDCSYSVPATVTFSFPNSLRKWPRKAWVTYRVSIRPEGQRLISLGSQSLDVQELTRRLQRARGCLAGTLGPSPTLTKQECDRQEVFLGTTFLITGLDISGLFYPQSPSPLQLTLPPEHCAVHPHSEVGDPVVPPNTETGASQVLSGIASSVRQMRYHQTVW